MWEGLLLLLLLLLLLVAAVAAFAAVAISGCGSSALRKASPARAPCVDLVDNGVWKFQTARVRSGLSLSPSYMPWTGITGNPRSLIGLPQTERISYVVNISWGSQPVTQRSFPWLQNMSQRVSRKLWGPVTPCLTATSIIYDFWPDSVWTADAKLCIHGHLWRELQVASLSEKETDESMFAPNVGAIVLSFVLNAHAPWGSPGGESCQSQAAPAAGARQHARARR